MEIRPWNNEIQRLGENLGNHWNFCDRLFISVFREEEGRETNSPQVGFNVWLVQEFARCIRLKNKEIDQYLQVVDHVMQDLAKISDIVQIGSFDSQEEFDWFRGCIRFLKADLPQVRMAVRDLLSSGTFGRNDRDALYAFFTFHGKLKELSKYCLLRMDVKRVQRKLVNRALFRINAELWEAIKSKGRTPIKEFLHQSKYRLENLNRLRSVERINYHLVDGIVFADKAYNPQLYKPSKNRVIQDVRSLSLDLGDNDIISGSFSLDREFEGFIATDSGVAESPVIIAFKGTDVFNWQDIKTDCAQALTCANDVYLQALGLLLSVRDVVGSMRTVRVYGHSLGDGQCMDYLRGYLKYPMCHQLYFSTPIEALLRLLL